MPWKDLQQRESRIEKRTGGVVFERKNRVVCLTAGQATRGKHFWLVKPQRARTAPCRVFVSRTTVLTRQAGGTIPTKRARHARGATGAAVFFGLFPFRALQAGGHGHVFPVVAGVVGGSTGAGLAGGANNQSNQSREGSNESSESNESNESNQSNQSNQPKENIRNWGTSVHSP